MLDWIKNIGKEVPEFWKTYLTTFNSKTTRYVVISCETSGSNAENDTILSVAAIGVTGKTLQIQDSFEIKINYDTEINTITKTAQTSEMNPVDALRAFIEFIGNAKLIGYRINFEVAILNEALSKLHCGKLKNEVFDLEVMHKKLENIVEDNFYINELFSIYGIAKSDRNSAAIEAFNMGLLFLKLKGRLKI